jgi:hypothetical protein
MALTLREAAETLARIQRRGSRELLDRRAPPIRQAE